MSSFFIIQYIYLAVNSFTRPVLTCPISGIIMVGNGDEGKSRSVQTPNREPGKLETGGEWPSNMAPEPRVRDVVRGVFPR